MDLIDRKLVLSQAWQDFYKLEDKHEKEGYDILRDRFYEQSGFECCQQAIVNADSVNTISVSELEELKHEMAQIYTPTEVEQILLSKCFCMVNDLIEKHKGSNNG